MKEQNIQTSLITKDYISFKTECDCFSHDLRVRFEKDGLGLYSLCLNDTVYIGEQGTGFFSRMWSRVKQAVKILFRGYAEIDYEFIFKGRAHVEEFLDYMNKSYEELGQK